MGGFTGFYWVFIVSAVIKPCCTRFYWVLPSITEFLIRRRNWIRAECGPLLFCCRWTPPTQFRTAGSLFFLPPPYRLHLQNEKEPKPKPKPETNKKKTKQMK